MTGLFATPSRTAGVVQLTLGYHAWISLDGAQDNGLVAQWIRHPPTEPRIAGSSPAEVSLIVKRRTWLCSVGLLACGSMAHLVCLLLLCVR